MYLKGVCVRVHLEEAGRCKRAQEQAKMSSCIVLTDHAEKSIVLGHLEQHTLRYEFGLTLKHVYRCFRFMCVSVCTWSNRFILGNDPLQTAQELGCQLTRIIQEQRMRKTQNLTQHLHVQKLSVTHTHSLSIFWNFKIYN